MESPASIGIVVSIATFFLWTVCYAITIAILYKKAGQSYWSAFIPVYHGNLMAKIAKKPIWAGIVFGITYDLWMLFSYTGLHGTIRGVVTLVAVVFGLYLLHHFVKQFDRGFGFWVLWLLLPFIAVFLAKNATYKNAPTNTPVAPQPPVGAPVAPSVPLETPQQFQPVAPQVQAAPQPQAQPFAQQPFQPVQPTQPTPAPAPVQNQTYPPASQPPTGPTV